jgi:hypothetical protein
MRKEATLFLFHSQSDSTIYIYILYTHVCTFERKNMVVEI